MQTILKDTSERNKVKCSDFKITQVGVTSYTYPSGLSSIHINASDWDQSCWLKRAPHLDKTVMGYKRQIH